MPLTAYRITTASGHTWVTDMAPRITLQDAKDYFLGGYFDVGGRSGPEKMSKVVKVEQIRGPQSSKNLTRRNPCGKGHKKNPTSIAGKARTALEAAGIPASVVRFKGRKNERRFKKWSISTRGNKTVLTIHVPNVNTRSKILGVVRNRAGLTAKWMDESERGVGLGRWVKYRLGRKA